MFLRPRPPDEYARPPPRVQVMGQENGEDELSPAKLARRLKSKGFEAVEQIREAGKPRRGFRGVALRQQDWEAA